jgi:hypothetical protein
MLKIPEFQNKVDLFAFLIEKKTDLMAQKMSTVKFADGVGVSLEVERGEVNKAASTTTNENEIRVKAVINTTNLMDSHKDVHLPGIWTKSLKENKRIMHIQEHQSNSFDKIISSGSDLQASTKTMTWKSLGFDAKGNTQALVFDSTVKASRNKFMFDLYKDGHVDNHSVSMRYVKISMAINSEDDAYITEKAVWDKYYPEIANNKEADNTGYFWAVTEAKVIEGSAVPMGSNPITPTISIKNEPSLDTQQKEAAKALQENRKQFFKQLIK